eukprot:UN06463
MRKIQSDVARLNKALFLPHYLRNLGKPTGTTDTTRCKPVVTLWPGGPTSNNPTINNRKSTPKNYNLSSKE